MKRIFLSELTSPAEAVENLIRCYKALKKSANRENDLRNYAKAILMIETLEQAAAMYSRKYALINGHAQHYCYIVEPSFLYVEEDDSIDDIMQWRYNFVYNPIMA